MRQLFYYYSFFYLTQKHYLEDYSFKLKDASLMQQSRFQKQFKLPSQRKH